MPTMRVKHYQFNSIPFVAIVDDSDIPVDPYASAYLSRHVASKPHNTAKRCANELLFVMEFFAEKNIDLTACVASGRLISQAVYVEFYEKCCFGKKYKVKDFVAGVNKISDKRLRNIIVANQVSVATLANETIRGRIRQLRKYIDWLFDQFHESISVGLDIERSRNNLISRMKLDEAGLGKGSRKFSVGSDESVIPDEVFLRLLEMIEPGSPNNPFRFSRVRNYLIVSVLIQCGIRRGALAKLKISDLHFWGSADQVKIYRSANDPLDPRTEKPNHKSKSHYATITPTLMRNIKLYIDLIRITYPSAAHDYIFVVENDTKKTLGNPISNKLINAIFRKISYSLGFHIHPHLLRHKWNELFDHAGTQQGVERLLLEDIRRYAMGWSVNSDMSRIYNDRALASKARALSIIHQSKMDR